jgi:hypothetical protein
VGLIIRAGITGGRHRSSSGRAIIQTSGECSCVDAEPCSYREMGDALEGDQGAETAKEEDILQLVRIEI